MEYKTKTVCKHCRKDRGQHNSTTAECPKGKAHRVIGHTWYGPEVFDPIEVRDRSQKEKIIL